MSIGNGVFSYMPPKRFRKMEAELATLSAFFARENDIVIVPQSIPDSWINKMKSLGFSMPVFLTKNEIPTNNIGYLRPWGWSPATHFYFKNIKQFTSSNFKHTVNSEWKESFRDLYSRKTSANILKKIIENANNPIFPSNEELPKICQSIDEVKAFVDCAQRVLLKAPWSSSGRGLYLLNPNEFNDINAQWVSGVLKSQKYVMAEYYKEKVCDLSFQFEVLEDFSIVFLGITFFMTDEKGNYKASYLDTESVLENNKELRVFLDSGILKIVRDKLYTVIQDSDISSEYFGSFGVDCMIYKEDGKFRFQPCIEINLRYNMGLLALKIRDKIHPDSRGIVVTEYVKHPEAFIAEMELKNPCLFKEELLYKGFVLLTIPSESNSFLTYILV